MLLRHLFFYFNAHEITVLVSQTELIAHCRMMGSAKSQCNDGYNKRHGEKAFTSSSPISASITAQSGVHSQLEVANRR